MLPFDENEHVVYEVRKHWFVMVVPSVLAVLCALVPFFVYLCLYIFAPAFNEVFAGYGVVLLFLWVLWLLIWWMFWFIKWTDYYLDVWYITNKRIIDVEQRGIFHRIVSTLRYEKVQDITFEVKGMFEVLIGFGDIHVQTAGEDQEIIIMHAKNPEGVKRMIVTQLDQAFEE